MSVEKIIEKISLEAADTARAIRRTAEEEAARYLEKEKTAAEAEKNAEIAARKREVDAEVSRMLAQARMEGRQTVRNARENLISNCFDRARERITAISGSPEYPEILKYLIQDGIEKIGAGDLTISANSRDIPVLESILAKETEKKVRMSDEPIPTSGGVLLRTGSGTRRVDNTFEARLERMRRDLIFEVAGILSGEREVPEE
ncbi:MAG: hypothetical protein APR55_06730 [Methanolinea sp. SDB]|nr:MAG: hypothetical protein APR55_06730 [Methanolinea sp. SDB]